MQGAVTPDEFYVHKPMLAARKRAVIRRTLGSKLIQMVFASADEKAASGKMVKTIDVPTEQRNRYSLTDADVEQLARYALIIEQHYGRPMDIEWGKDGGDGQLYILQARPETVKSQQQGKTEQRYRLKSSGSVLACSASGAPSNMMVPLAMTTAWSQTGRVSRTWWLTTMQVRPKVWLSRRSRLMITPLAIGSSPVSGSS